MSDSTSCSGDNNPRYFLCALEFLPAVAPSARRGGILGGVELGAVARPVARVVPGASGDRFRARARRDLNALERGRALALGSARCRGGGRGGRRGAGRRRFSGALVRAAGLATN